MSFAVRLLVGLGNPGAQYAHTRHNAGAWLAERLAEQYSMHLRFENKFHGFIAEGTLQQHSFYILIPTTFMNESGRSVSAVTKFYKIPPQSILVAHDELDFPVGMIRIKKDGGHGGHNGLRSIIEHLHTRDFFRLRIGIGHPGDRQEVVNYVLSDPSRADKQQIVSAIDEGLHVLPDLLVGDIDKATRELHGK